jgi:hypothetical protein
MANRIPYSALGSFTTAIAGAATAPTLKNLANSGRKIGNAIDLTGAGTARNVLVYFELLWRNASAPAANAPIELYLIPSIDGTNYDDADDSTDPPASHLIYTFQTRAVATAQRRSNGPRPLILPAVKFKPFIYNKSGQAFTNTDNENVLSYRIVDYEVQ